MPRRYVCAVFPEVSPLWGYEGDTSAPNGQTDWEQFLVTKEKDNA